MRVTLIPALLLSSAMAFANDYSSRDVFTMVANCMDENGGHTHENLLMCSCRVDLIQAEMSAPDYEDAVTVERYRDVPADKGAVFRDSKKGQELFEALRKIRKKAAETCPAIRSVNREPKSITRE